MLIFFTLKVKKYHFQIWLIGKGSAHQASYSAEPVWFGQAIRHILETFIFNRYSEIMYRTPTHTDFKLAQ